MLTYLYTEYYKNISSASGDCDCIALEASVTQLEEAVANVKEIANENKLAREREHSLAWIPTVEDLKLGLQNVQKSLALNREKEQNAQHNVMQLQASHLDSQQDIERSKSIIGPRSRKASSYTAFSRPCLRIPFVTRVTGAFAWGRGVGVSWHGPLRKKEFLYTRIEGSIRDMQEQINGYSRSFGLNAELCYPSGDGSR